MMDEHTLKKLDPVSRFRVGEGSLQAPMEVLVSTDTRAVLDRLQTLKDAGLEVHTVAGTVVCGRLTDLDALEALARLPHVTQIEVSHPLARE